jgi:membrane protein DedA with SNARE-associated domain
MNEIKELLSSYGQWFYLIAFVWAFLEGETFLIFAGFAAQRGYLNIEALVVCAWLGSLSGDQLFFSFGRYFGTRIFIRFPNIKSRVAQVTHWLERYAIAFILSYRFIYGVRNVSSIAVGMSDLSWRIFAFWNAIAAFIWASAFSGFGYFFGDFIERLPKNAIISDVQQIMLLILALFVLFLVIRQVIARFKK